MYKVRFNLGRGKNFKKWKVTNTEDGEVNYYDPNEVSLLLVKPILRNNRKSADRIFNGHNKYVCAWIECESYKAFTYYNFNKNLSQVSFNPRVKPYWRDFKGNNIDDCFYTLIETIGKDVFAVV